MKSMRRSVLAVLLVAAMLILTLTACGGDPAVSDAGSEPGMTTGANSTTTTTTGADSADDTTTGDTTSGTVDNGTTSQPTGSTQTTGKVTNGKSTTTTTKKTTAPTKGDGFKGTTYYVSSSAGNDWNDGDSEAKPVKSLAIASTLGEPGDRVLFKRGDIWRADTLTTRSGVTYGAYGSGENPRFYGSSKNYAIKDKWKQTSNSRVWYFDEPITVDVGGVTMNDGASYGDRKESVAALKGDRNYYYDPNEGRVYLFSRNGNPAEVWSTIEFNERINLVSLKSNDVVFENITIRYCDYGIVGGGNKNVVIKNCEFAWIGGCLHSYSNKTRFGNAIEFWGGVDGLTVDNCRFSQIFDTAITSQYQGNTKATIRNVTVSNNKVDKCQWSMEFWLECKDSSGKYNGVIDGIKILNNEFTNAGKGWSAGQRWGGGGLASSCHFMTMGASGYSVSNVLIKNNLFKGAASGLMGIYWLNYMPTFEGNTFVQEKGKSFGNMGANGSWTFDDSIVEKIKKIDSKAKVEFSK